MAKPPTVFSRYFTGGTPGLRGSAQLNCRPGKNVRKRKNSQGGEFFQGIRVLGYRKAYFYAIYRFNSVNHTMKTPQKIAVFGY